VIKPTDTQGRRKRYEELRKIGLDSREAGIATFPEMPADTAEAHGQALIPTPEVFAPDAVKPRDLTREISAPGMRDRVAAQGLPPDVAQAMANAAVERASTVATPENVMNYDRLDVFESRLREKVGNFIVDNSSIIEDWKADNTLLLSAVGSLFSGVQQSWFSFISGENHADVVDRLWPDVDIRDDDNTIQRKAMVPYAMRAIGTRIAGQFMQTLNIGPHRAMIDKARQMGGEVAESMHEDMLTGQRVSEYNLMGYGAFANKLPLSGTPEREVYDKVIRDEVSQEYMEWKYGDNLLGKAAMYLFPVFNAGRDIFEDPTIVLSEAPKAMVTGARMALPASTTARVTGAVARRTGRVSDLTTAVKDAEKWMETAGDTLVKQPTKNNAMRLLHAQKNIQRLKSDLAGAQAALSEKVRLRTAPRIHPDHIQPIADVFLGAAKGTRTALTRDFIRRQTSVATKTVKRLEKQIERLKKGPQAQGELFEAADLGEDLPTLERQLASAKQNRLEWVETRKSFNLRASNPRGARTEAFLKMERMKQGEYQPDAIALGNAPLGEARTAALRSIHENIQRGIEQGAPEDEIIQWEHLFSQVSSGTEQLSDPLVRPTITARDIIAQNIDDARRTALSADPTPVRAYGMDSDDPVQLRQRLALGPDQAEEAGEAARLLAAGADLDDVTFRGLSIDLYNSSYGSRMRPERAGEDIAIEDAWLGEEALRTKMETALWQQTVAEKMSDKFAAALYPMTWNKRAPWMLQKIREPMRVLQSVNPKLYTRVHNAVHAQEFELMRMNELFSRELEVLGVKVRVAPRSTGSSVGPEFIVNERKAKEFYELMNMDPTTDKFLDSLTALPEEAQRSIRRIRQELDFGSNKLGISQTDKRIEGWISHVFDRRWFDGGARPSEFSDLGATAEVFMQQLLTREDKGGYVPDLALALDTYTRALSRKLHIEPLLQDLETAAKVHLRSTKGQDAWFVAYIDDMINNFKGKPSLAGQVADREGAAMRAHLKGWGVVESGTRKLGGMLERVGEYTVASSSKLGPGKLGKAIEAVGTQVIGAGEQMATKGLPQYVAGDASRTAMGVSSLAYSSVLSGNKRYFPMAVATGLATTGARYGIFNTLHGIMMMATSEGRTLAKTAGIDRQWLQIMEAPAWKKASEAASKAWVFGPSIHATENLVRGWTFHAALGDLMRKQGLKSWDDVVEAGLGNSFLHEATRATEEVNHLFGQLGKPATFGRYSRSVSVGLTQFLSFMPKQTEELLAQTMTNPGYIGQYMMISGMLTRIGSEVGIDLTEYVGFGYLPSKVSELQTIAMETANSLVSLTGNIGSFALGSGDPVKTKRSGEDFLRNMANFLPLYTATRQTGKMMEMLRTGAQFAGGTKVRDVDLGQFEWDANASVASNLADIPSGLVPQTGASAPTEMASVLSSMNSLQGRLERQQFDAMRKNALEKTYYIERLAEDLSEAVRTGDNRAFDKTIMKMIDEGVIPSDIANMAGREAMQLVVPRMLREQMRDTRLLLNNTEDIQRIDQMYDMQFGR